MDALNNLGVLLARRGNFPAAIRLCRRAIRLQPRDPSAYYNLAVILIRQGKEPEAVPYLEKVISLKPDYEPAQRLLRKYKISNNNDRNHKL